MSTDRAPLTPASISALRAQLGITQAVFAARLNELVPGLRTTNVTVARWERGTHQPSAVAAEAIRRMMASGHADQRVAASQSATDQ